MLDALGCEKKLHSTRAEALACLHQQLGTNEFSTKARTALEVRKNTLGILTLNHNSYPSVNLGNSYPSVNVVNFYPSVKLGNSYPSVNVDNSYPSVNLGNSYPSVNMGNSYPSVSLGRDRPD